MSAFTLSLFFLCENERHKHEKIRRRILRDHSNPLDLPQAVFIAYYRVDKDCFRSILDEVRPLLKQSSISAEIRLCATLRFFAEGGFQRAIGKFADIALARSTISKQLTEMIQIMERVLCPKWITLKTSPDEIRRSKEHFSNNFNIPGVIGCVDGTHIKLLKPTVNEHLFYNRKGCFSINAMIVCDYRMVIKAVDACHQGSCDDGFIFNLSKVKEYLQHRYDNGDRNSWLLGDSGYGLETFLLTPYRDPTVGTMQHKFNTQHAKARNIVERVIGELKSRFKCLQTTLPYAPQKVVKIINVCCALHNICRVHNVTFAEDFAFESTVEEMENDEDNSRNINAARSIRDEIANNLETLSM